VAYAGQCSVQDRPVREITWALQHAGFQGACIFARTGWARTLTPKAAYYRTLSFPSAPSLKHRVSHPTSSFVKLLESAGHWGKAAVPSQTYLPIFGGEARGTTVCCKKYTHYQITGSIPRCRLDKASQASFSIPQKKLRFRTHASHGAGHSHTRKQKAQAKAENIARSTGISCFVQDAKVVDELEKMIVTVLSVRSTPYSVILPYTPDRVATSLLHSEQQRKTLAYELYRSLCGPSMKS
jgi:hypothetical protein